MDSQICRFYALLEYVLMEFPEIGEREKDEEFRINELFLPTPPLGPGIFASPFRLHLRLSSTRSSQTPPIVTRRGRFLQVWLCDTFNQAKWGNGRFSLGIAQIW